LTGLRGTHRRTAIVLQRAVQWSVRSAGNAGNAHFAMRELLAERKLPRDRRGGCVCLRYRHEGEHKDEKHVSHAHLKK